MLNTMCSTNSRNIPHHSDVFSRTHQPKEHAGRCWRGVHGPVRYGPALCRDITKDHEHNNCFDSMTVLYTESPKSDKHVNMIWPGCKTCWCRLVEKKHWKAKHGTETVRHRRARVAYHNLPLNWTIRYFMTNRVILKLVQCAKLTSVLDWVTPQAILETVWETDEESTRRQIDTRKHM